MNADNIGARGKLPENSMIGQQLQTKPNTNAIKNASGSDFSTFYGGTDSDRINDIAVDSEGNIYVTGGTESTGSIGFNGHRTSSYGGTDAFLVKFDETGKRLWATYIGGSTGDLAYSVAVSDEGYIYIAGQTNSDDLETSNDSHQTDYGGGLLDGFLAQLDLDGTFNWITYFGGSDEDIINSIDCDAFGNVIITGFTKSSSGIASNGNINSYMGAYDGFVALFNPLGERQWATYAGGSEDDIHNTVFVDGNDIWVGGSSDSPDIDITGAFQSSFAGGDWDAWVERYSRNGSFISGSYLGGSWFEEVYSIQKSNDIIYCAGYTRSRDMPEVIDQLQNGSDVNVFLTAIDSTEVHWTKTFGGTLDDQAFGLEEIQGKLLLTGATRGNGFPISSNATQANIGGRIDAFWAIVDNKGSIEYSSYLGGDSIDVGVSIASLPVEGKKAVGIAGYTWSKTIFGNNGHQLSNRGEEDGFMTKFTLGSEFFPTITITADSLPCPGESIVINITSEGYQGTPKFTAFLENSEGETQIGSGAAASGSSISAQIPSTLNGFYSIFLRDSLGNESNRVALLPDYQDGFEIKLFATGPDVCPDALVQLGTKDAFGYKYKWTVNGAELFSVDSAAFLNIISGTSGQIEVNLKVSLNGKDDESCVWELERTLNIAELPELTISGPDTICSGVEQAFSVEEQGEGWQYNWMIIGGETLTDETSNSVTARYQARGRITLSAYSPEGCNIIVSKNIYIKAAPSFTLTGPDASCKGCEEVYEFDTDGAVTQIDATGGTILSSTDSTARVRWDELGGQVLTVVYRNPGGVECTFAKELVVQVEEEQPLVISGPAEVCLGEETEYVTSGSDDFTYEWSVEGTSVLDPETGKKTSVVWDESGFRKIRLIRVRKSDQTSDTLFKTIEIRETPQITSYELSNEICEGGDVGIAVSTEGVTGYLLLEIPTGSEPIQKTSLNHIFTVEKGYESITVRVGTNDCVSEPLTIELDVLPTPNKGVIVETGKGLQSLEEAEEYIWFKDGDPYPADTRYIEPVESGTFTLALGNGECEGELSEAVNFIFKSVEDELTLRIYYSPVNGGLMVGNQALLWQPLKVYDISGRLVHSADAEDFNPLNLQSGTYFYIIDSESGSQLSGKFQVIR